jgi:hypothetical protein
VAPPRSNAFKPDVGLLVGASGHHRDRFRKQVQQVSERPIIVLSVIGEDRARLPRSTRADDI